jgi:hypothetical protein
LLIEEVTEMPPPGDYWGDTKEGRTRAKEGSEAVTRYWKENGKEVFCSTDKIEPKEVVQTELLYRWREEVKAIRCVLNVKYPSIFHGDRTDSRTVVRWFVRPSTPAASPPV